ncbi:hypothetical protein [Ichthyenterobacterium magnum]|uniref:Glycine dehydrogenase n=1 Tax=Ichthyenterobacterium magnum TaxID=1230530 RepID=A0A420DF11_9FLAO|nr:hypothetical protein [Ichthyenterobacterium magnum]RKE90985.1 hypothetical protein BXY80_2575 [Ichthyenterobacterium magnum]
MKKSILFISCEEAHHICDKSQYGEASIWEKFKLNLRLSWCRISRAYTKKNRALTKAVNNSDVDCLKDNERNDLKTKFDSQLHNQN